MSVDSTVRAIEGRLRQLKAQAQVQELGPNEVALNRYPGLPQPYSNVASHQKLLEAVKEALETLLRARGAIDQSAVTVGELQALGLVDVLPNGLVTSPVLSRLSGWESSAAERDWTPTGSNQWVGDADKMPRGLAVGAPTNDPATPGVEGVLVERTGAQDGAGGVALVGYANVDTSTKVTDPGTLADSPVEIAGVPVLIAGATFLQVSQPLTDEHYVLLGESTTLADGRHFAPLSLGPAYVPTQSESAPDTRDIDLDETGTLESVVTLGPLANSYLGSGGSTFRYEVRLSEEGGRRVDFDVEIWIDDGLGGGYVFAFRDEFALDGQAQNVSQAFPTVNPIAAGSSIQMRVSGLGSHPQSDGWVRGSVRASLLELRQGG